MAAQRLASLVATGCNQPHAALTNPACAQCAPLRVHFPDGFTGRCVGRFYFARLDILNLLAYQCAELLHNLIERDGW
jgi:hypothetical protein